MAMFGGARDVSLMRHVNRELEHNIVSQQAIFYKYRLEETVTNMYGEASTEKYFEDPVILFCLIDRNDQAYNYTGEGANLNQQISFYFLRDDLVDANVVPEIGDIILYQEGYHEVDTVVGNQYWTGKNPNYPNYDSDGNNPLNPGLENFGYNVSILCRTHYVPQDKLSLTPYQPRF
jgi:hypothetical protein|tara:strand:- start:614 stop:1141 length:528 start_codon:yes stop_codon:yes gene_type:complete